MKEKMDKETFDLIESISEKHSSKVFGYLDKEDLKNEIWTICLEKMAEFDGDRGELEHFLRVSVKNRLINKFKDITKSVKSPCIRCPHYRPHKEVDCKMFGVDKHQCSKWNNYKLSVESRNSLLNATEQKFDQSSGFNVVNKVMAQELINKIEPHLPEEYKHDFNQLITNGKINKKKIRKITRVILNVLNNKDADA